MSDQNHNDDPTGGVRSLLPSPALEDRKGAGGTHSHKPGCGCYPCKARARKQETLTLPTGDGGLPLDTSEISPEKPLIAEDIVALPVGRGSYKRPTLAKKTIVAELLKLRTIDPDITNVEAARQMGISRTHLQYVLQQAAKEGWLVFNDPLARIEHQIIPQAVENASAFLTARDKQVTIEVLKGTVFKAYQESKGLNQNHTTVLALKIELPQTENAQLEIIEGQIVGKPKVITDKPHE